MRRGMCIAAVVCLLPGSARAAEFTLGFDGCPGRISAGTYDSDVNFQLTGTLTSAVDGWDGAQGWSFGVIVTNGDFSGFDTTFIIPTLYQKTTGGVMTEKDLVIDDAGFYSAELLPVEGAPKTGFITGIIFSTSKKQVLYPVGTVATVHLQVHSEVPDSQTEMWIAVSYQAGLQGSGQPVDNVITLNSESITPDTQGCETRIGPEPPPAMVFNLALVPPGVTPAPRPADTTYAMPIVAGGGCGSGPATVTVPVQVVLSTANIPENVPGQGDGPQGWSLSITSDNPAGVYSNPDVCGLHVKTIYEKVKGSPNYDYDFDLCDAGFNETAVTVDGKGVVSAIVFSTSKKQVLHANATDRILNFDYTLPVDGEDVSAKLFFQDGGQGAGQPVNNVVTYNTASMTPPTLTFQALRLEILLSADCPGSFIRGDLNGDGEVDLADAIFIVYAVVPGFDAWGSYSIGCFGAADANADESVNLADAIYLIDYQFRGGAPPAEPFPACGTDGATWESCRSGSTACR
jgi:hypothetical protein